MGKYPEYTCRPLRCHFLHFDKPILTNYVIVASVAQRTKTCAAVVIMLVMSIKTSPLNGVYCLFVYFPVSDVDQNLFLLTYQPEGNIQFIEPMSKRKLTIISQNCSFNRLIIKLHGVKSSGF